ncbi:MAG: hypothetical protein P1V97_39780 [Planctomycetota bacterium]|nr:hypothetical protein [Planctomycetota bacterium]
MELGMQSQESITQSNAVPWWHPQKAPSSDASGQNSKPSFIESEKPWWMDEADKSDSPTESKLPKIDQSILKAQRGWETPSKPAPKRPSKRPAVEKAAQKVARKATRLSQAAREKLTQIFDAQAESRLSNAISPSEVIKRTGPAFVGLSLEQLSEVEADFDAPVPMIEPAPFASREELRERRRRKKVREIQRKSKKKGVKIRRKKTRKTKKVATVALSHSEKEAIPYRALPSFDEELIGGPAILRIEETVVLENDGASLQEGPWLPRSLQFLHRYLSS